MRARISPLILATAIAGVLAACAAGTAGGSGSTASRDIITRSQLAEIPESTAYDAIRRLRPRWLRRRGTRNELAVVYQDNFRLGELDQLRSIMIEQVAEIRFISASDATTRWGTGHSGGAIQVITQR